MPKKEEVKTQVEPKALDRHDIMQILIGAAVLSVPVGFTEETWKLGENLPFPNVLGLVVLAWVFIAYSLIIITIKSTSTQTRCTILER